MSLDWGRAEECRIRHNDAECGPTPATPWRARSAQSDSENDGRRIVGRTQPIGGPRLHQAAIATTSFEGATASTANEIGSKSATSLTGSTARGG